MNHETTHLPYGLRVVTVPLKERKSVSIGLWASAGARDEEPKINGISHFLEHLVFKGTPTRTANDIKESVEGVGGSFNAFTSEECTCYLAKAASRHFEGVFDVLSDMVLNASLKQADIDKERTVIMEEIKMTQDQPANHVEEILADLMWPGHALGRPITGTLESVAALTRDELVNYRDAHYNPAYLTVVAAGAIDHKTLLTAAQSRFAARPGSREKIMHPHKSTQGAPQIRTHQKKTEQTHLALGIRGLPKEHPDEFALDLLSIILGGNMSSRLFNEVREERGLAYDIGSSVRKYNETGAFVVSAGVDPHKFGEALTVIVGELRKIATFPIENAELARAKEFFVGQMELGLENSMNNMLWAGESILALGRCQSPDEVAEKIMKVTPGDVGRVARALFLPGAMSLAAVGPLEANNETEALKALAG